LRTAQYISTPLPLWAKRIRSLRLDLRLNQQAFGKKLNCSSMGVSRWERGLAKPPASCFIAMGKIAGPPEGWYFWKLAGIRAADCRKMLAPKRR